MTKEAKNAIFKSWTQAPEMYQEPWTELWDTRTLNRKTAFILASSPRGFVYPESGPQTKQGTLSHTLAQTTLKFPFTYLVTHS